MNHMATVYIPLTDEGVNVWRPVQAEHVGGDLYRLTGQPPDGETWAFGTRRCRQMQAANAQRRWEPRRISACRVRESNAHLGLYLVVSALD